MNDFKKILISPHITIHEALSLLDETALRILLVVDNEQKLQGTITDGDIRRGLLTGLTIEDGVSSIIFDNPTVGFVNESNSEIVKKATSKKLHQIPIVDAEFRVVGLKEIDELIRSEIKPNKVIIMAGGLGTRLHPLTKDIPKPLLKVGDKPILETIVSRLASYGFINVVMCVNYKAKMIQDYFGDGSNFGVNIEYILEKERMGTAGALSLLTAKPEEPFFVMNGDILTNINFENLLDYHQSNQAKATMCVRDYNFHVPYGVVKVEGNQIKSIEEKPEFKFFVSAGIYMLSPETIKYLPKNEYFDMPELFEKLILKNQPTISFPIHEYWLDIGQVQEFEQANREYKRVFK